ncbi:Domain of uncharacterised function (DUF407) [Raoultella terrigena]|uniref:Domain of uncharacterized function (DUF407) n=1 Tax=Raoultella terrigena TaxID=577 RepID=A0A3P8M2E1_RAOTE|nr:Domain of uncharacterised function (DUF407) [Raoultella terrigena]
MILIATKRNYVPTHDWAFRGCSRWYAAVTSCWQTPLGSGVLEAPALLAFLAEISQCLLGEPLLIPTVKTWWCGRAEDRDFVIRNLEHLIIKPSWRSFDSKSIYGHSLDDHNRMLTVQQITANPHNYVAQVYIPGSRVPVWDNQQIEYRPRYFPRVYRRHPGGVLRHARNAITGS